MSRLVHLCTGCRHPRASHNTIGAVYKVCTCCRRDARDITVDAEPTIMPTFDLATHKPDPLHEPGTKRNAGTGHAETLCGCEACVAAYEREVG